MTDQLVLTPPDVKAEIVQDKWERLMQHAIEQKAGAEQFAMLVDAMIRARKEDGRLQFEAALGRFKTHLPQVLKTKTVSYQNKDGSTTSYSHAELDKISEIIAEELGKEGLTHSWRPGEGANGRTLVTCVFRHPASGHAEDMATLGGPPDTSGGKNSVQAIGSTTYYLERYTLLAASGIVPKGIDDDGRGACGLPAEELAEMLRAIEGCATKEAVLKEFKKSYPRASGISDQESMRTLSSAKDKRIAELKSPKPAEAPKPGNALINEAQRKLFWETCKATQKSNQQVKNYFGTIGIEETAEMRESQFPAAFKWAGEN